MALKHCHPGLFNLAEHNHFQCVYFISHSKREMLPALMSLLVLLQEKNIQVTKAFKLP